MKLLPKQISKEEFDYVSDKSVDDFKSDIQQLFDKTNGWNFSINLTGKFTSDNEFSMTPKWQFAYIRSSESKISYLHGHIFQDEHKRTRVRFTVRPNSIYAMFFFIGPLFGLLILTSDNIKGDETEAKIAGLLITLIIPVVMLIQAHFAKEGIKNRFIKAFDLKPAN